MKVIRRFKEEHKDILALLSELWREVKEVECTEQNIVDCERMRIFVNVRDAITQYFDIEERFFFPVLERFVEMRPLINEAYGAHRRISDLVAKMEKFRLAKQCDRWDEDMTQLIQSIRRHFDWEEHALSPRAIRLLGEAGLERMHFEIEAARKGQVRNKQRGFSARESSSVFECGPCLRNGSPPPNYVPSSNTGT